MCRRVCSDWAGFVHQGLVEPLDTEETDEVGNDTLGDPALGLVDIDVDQLLFIQEHESFWIAQDDYRLPSARADADVDR